MAVENELALGIMLTLATLTMILVIPWPLFIRKPLLRIYSIIMHEWHVRVVLAVLMAIVLILYITSFRKMLAASNALLELEENKDMITLDMKLNLQNKLFLSQRNVYITGGALYLIPVLYRLHQVLSVVALQGGVAELKEYVHKLESENRELKKKR